MHESTHEREQVEQNRPPSIVENLRELVDSEFRFSTVYADRPWQYSNPVSRGAANNHYSTMTVQQICDEPVRELVNDNALLHLWTTNAFLREAFEVMEARGFQYKSCLVWVKPQLGMGNYWRVSHEFLCDRSHKYSYVVSRIMLCCHSRPLFLHRFRFGLAT
ncbi:MT-A70 family methyltransferase [Fuerstiella marisgermanici]|uniref:Transcriptional activator, adenine-specific DNA methyltransferase n=1 Tax=Fuerstiella marisgermanici TaxID=1891926 RepID=A0A1P8WQN2_9PLAN|nr:MT-A70 family methyltransferase [Fuerstiella marisgermanici]APZ96358.1 Transcriptional activator, adenine-specific DNA methyltransferase [Fuerstiella marisgermanici]